MAKLDFVPSEHEIIGFFSRAEVPLDGDLAQEKARYLSLLRPWEGTCWRCGQALVYVVVTKHSPSGSYRAIGEQCCEHLIGSDEKYQLIMLREATERGRAAERNRQYRYAFSQTEPEIFEFLRSASADPSDHLDFVVDVARRFFGDKPHLSDKQVEALRKCLAGRRKFLAIKEQRRAERPATAIVPVGKGTEVIGQVIKLETRENDYGLRTVFTVKTKEGWIVWGTVPASIAKVKEGDWVRFVGNTEASDKDEGFGFFARPRKAEILGAEPEDEVTECVDCGSSLAEVVNNDRCPDCRGIPF